MEKKLLNVGDVLYSESYNKIYGVYKIDRVTATQAISGKTRFRRDYWWSASVIGANSWSSMRYYLETEELKIKFERQQIIEMINGNGLNDLTIEELRQIKKMISDKKDERSVATTDQSR